MSQQNVEIVRRLYEAVEREGLGVIADFAHSEMEVVPPSDWPESRTLRGLERVEDFARQWVETFQTFKFDPERFVDPGGNRVVVYVRDRGRIRDSASEIDTLLIHVWTLAESKITRWQVFMDEDEALKAAGLSE